jgi:hypothetical protein
MDKALQAKVTGKAEVYIHNHLGNSAFWFKQQIEQKIKGDRSGIAFDYMSCAVMIAFTNEAHVNFIGYKKIPGFNEWQAIEGKLGTVLQALKLPIVWETRPLSSLRRMKNLRDSLAHGKPAEIRHDKVVAATHNQLELINDLNQAYWQKDISHESVFEAYFDMNDLWNQMVAASGLSVFDTLDQSSFSISLIEPAM